MSENPLRYVSRKSIRQASSLGLLHRLLPATSRLAVTILATAVLLLGLSSGYAATQLTETFTGGFGNWTLQSGLTDNGFNLGWANSANAGGAAGEIGGLVVLYNGGDAFGMPRILDPLGASALNLNSPLSVSGQMYLDGVTSPNMNVHIGYYNTADPGNQNLMLRMVSPTSDRWRFQFRGNGANGSRVTVPDTTWDATPLGFSFTWTPSGLNNGAGTIAGQVTKGATVLTVTSFAAPANTAVFDAFGLWIDSGGSTDITRTQIEWFDNITYTVPEPSAASLCILAGALSLLARRKLRRA